MARKHGALTVSNSFEYTVSAPADARLLVNTKTDLYDADSFPFPYVGMIVSTKDEGKAYILKALPTTATENWAEVGADIDTSVLEAEIQKRAEGYIESTTETANIGDDKTLVENQIITVKSSDGTKSYQGSVDNTGVASIDVEGQQVRVFYDDTSNQLIMENTGGADVDSTKVDITTEIVHKIDGRLIPHGGSGSTQDYLDNALTVKEEQGKYHVGDVIPKDTLLQEIIINMLTKVNNPTVGNISASISGTGDKLLESGATQNVTITLTLDRGAVSPVYHSGAAYKAGEATAYSVNGGGEQSTNTFTETVSEANKEFVGTIKYAAGEDILDDEGGVYMSATGAGQATTNTLKYDFVDALYSNASNINTVAKESLIAKSTGQKVFNFPAAPDGTAETFDVPASWSVIAVEVENELSGKYENAASEFTVTDVTHPNAASVDVAYKRYTDNRGYASGARKVRVRWS